MQLRYARLARKMTTDQLLEIHAKMERLPTTRQTVLIGHLVAGLTQQQAAEAMGVHPQTVVNMLKHARARMGATTTLQLVVKCLRLGMFAG